MHAGYKLILSHGNYLIPLDHKTKLKHIKGYCRFQSRVSPL